MKGKPGLIHTPWDSWSLIHFELIFVYMPVYSVASVCPTLCNAMDCSLPGSSVHGFSRWEYWSGLPCPPPGDLPHLGIKPVSPALTGVFFTTEPSGKPFCVYSKVQIHSFAYGYLITSVSIFEKIILPVMEITYWHLCGKSVDHRCLSLFPDS